MCPFANLIKAGFKAPFSGFVVYKNWNAILIKTEGRRLLIIFKWASGDSIMGIN